MRSSKGRANRRVHAWVCRNLIFRNKNKFKKREGGEGRLSKHVRQTNTEASGSGAGAEYQEAGLTPFLVFDKDLPRSLKESSCVGLCGDEMQQMRFAFNSIIRKRNSEELNGWC